MGLMVGTGRGLLWMWQMHFGCTKCRTFLD